MSVSDERVNELVETMTTVDLAASPAVSVAPIDNEREWLDAFRVYRDRGGSATALRAFLASYHGTSGPAAFVVRQAKVIDRLITCLVKSGDYSYRRAMDAEFDESIHEAIHALKRLHEFADVIGGTWTGAAEMVFAARLRWVMESTQAGHRSASEFGVHWIGENLDAQLTLGSSYEEAIDTAMALDAATSETSA